MSVVAQNTGRAYGVFYLLVYAIGSALARSLVPSLGHLQSISLIFSVANISYCLQSTMLHPHVVEYRDSECGWWGGGGGGLVW